MNDGDILLEIRHLSQQFKGSVGINFLYNMLRKKHSIKAIRRALVYLHMTGKIEMNDYRIKPTMLLPPSNVTDSKIFNVFAKLGQGTPADAYELFLKMYGFVNPETFTRRVRLLGKDGKLKRQANIYSLKRFEQRNLKVAMRS